MLALQILLIDLLGLASALVIVFMFGSDAVDVFHGTVLCLDLDHQSESESRREVREEPSMLDRAA